MKFSVFATPFIIGLALISPAMGCGYSPSINSQIFDLLNRIFSLLTQISIQLETPRTTTTTTTTTRAPSACEIERAQLLASNPQGRHVPVCMSYAQGGQYRPDQYQADGVNFCYDLEGNKIEGSIVFDGAQSGRYNECLAMRS